MGFDWDDRGLAINHIYGCAPAAPSLPPPPHGSVYIQFYKHNDMFPPPLCGTRYPSSSCGPGFCGSSASMRPSPLPRHMIHVTYEYTSIMMYPPTPRGAGQPVPQFCDSPSVSEEGEPPAPTPIPCFPFFCLFSRVCCPVKEVLSSCELRF